MTCLACERGWLPGHHHMRNGICLDGCVSLGSPIPPTLGEARPASDRATTPVRDDTGRVRSAA